MRRVRCGSATDARRGPGLGSGCASLATLLAAVVQSAHLTGAGGVAHGSDVLRPWLTDAPMRAGEAAWEAIERAPRRLAALVAEARWCLTLAAYVRAWRAATAPLPVTRSAPDCTRTRTPPRARPRRSPFRNPTAARRPLPQAADERRPGAMKPAAPLRSPKPPAMEGERTVRRPLPPLTARARATAPSTAAGE
jgi:hypothetical protein